MKLSDLVAEFVAKDVRPKCWVDRLSETQRKEFESIKKKFKSGQYGKTSKRSLARAIVAAAKDRGVQICGENGVREWLARD